MKGFNLEQRLKTGIAHKAAANLYPMLASSHVNFRSFTYVP
jgi:hypothetical protein